jgi:WD40 repeat protein
MRGNEQQRTLAHDLHMRTPLLTTIESRKCRTRRCWPDPSPSGKEIAVLKGHAGPVKSAAFSGDGKRVVTASSDNTARIWR